MLGNFSFGDYFKESAIDYAWNLVTKIYELKEEQLLITVYEEDEEAFNIYGKKYQVCTIKKIIKINTSDNFGLWGILDLAVLVQRFSTIMGSILARSSKRGSGWR